MKLLTEKDEILRRYLLDQLSDEEQNSLEEKFLENDELFDEMDTLRNKLESLRGKKS